MILRLYARALRLLRPDIRRAVVLAVGNVGLGALAVLEPVLFGRVVDALTRGSGPWPLIGLWAALGVASIGGAAIVSLLADRMSHRRRLAAMNEAFDRAVTLPAPFVSEQGTGRLIRAMLAGGDALFALILSFFREQQPAFVSLALLLPLAFWINPVLATVLGRWRRSTSPPAGLWSARPRRARRGWSAIIRRSPAGSATSSPTSAWSRPTPAPGPRAATFAP